jgi:hypothetical protein
VKDSKGNIEWEILYPDSLMEDIPLSELGYVGGIKIGRNRILLLKHLKVVKVKETVKEKVKTKGGKEKEVEKEVEREELRISAPRFMLFDDKASPKKRESGLPMSRDELNRLLEFLFGERQTEEIVKEIFGPGSEAILKEVKPSTSIGPTH